MVDQRVKGKKLTFDVEETVVELFTVTMLVDFGVGIDKQLQAEESSAPMGIGLKQEGFGFGDAATATRFTRPGAGLAQVVRGVAMVVVPVPGVVIVDVTVVLLHDLSTYYDKLRKLSLTFDRSPWLYWASISQRA